MPHYIVRETIITIRYIEAESKEAALDKANAMSPSDYAETDASQAPCWSVEEYDPEG